MATKTTQHRPNRPTDAGLDASGVIGKRTTAVTPRAFAIGLVLALLMCAITPYNDYYVAATYLSGNFFPIGAIGAVIILTMLVNPLLISLRRARYSFSPSEIITIWSMMLVVSGIPSSGMMRYLIPHIAAPNYYATPSNGWVTLIIAHMPSYLVLSDPAAAKAFFEGSGPHGGVPWAAWTAPLLCWGIFIAFLLLAFFCLSTIVRRQWVENEHFSFPLVQLPVLLAEAPEPGQRVNKLIRSPLLWVGVAAVTALHTIKGLHQLFPSVPDIPLVWHSSDYLTVRPWNGLNDVEVEIFPLVIGFAFLLPTEVCTSLWLFFLVFKLTTMLGYQYAWNMAGPNAGICMGPAWAAYQEAGGALMLCTWLIWSMRAHLRDIWRKAVFDAADVDDEREPLSYRFALFGLALAYVGMFFWLTVAARVDAPLALGVLIGSLVVFLVLSWMVAQAGLLLVQQSFSPAQITTVVFGSTPFNAASLATGALTEHVGWYDAREFMMPSLLNAGKAATETNLNPRTLTRAMALCVLLGVGVAGAASIWLPYTHGGGAALKNEWMYIDAPQIPFNWASSLARDPQPPQASAALNIAAGALVVLFLFMARNAFPWFGLHPAGFLVAATYPMYTLWFSLLIGGMLKAPILRYGGSRGYRLLLPLFLGFILGDCMNALAWTVIGLITGTGYNLLPG